MFSKFIAVAFAAMVSTAATAAQPSLFNCKSEDGTLEVHYTTTSFTGQPTFSVTKNGQSLTSGPNLLVNVQSSKTPLGQFVSAMVTRRFIADAPSLVYGVFIPGIELGHAHEVNFSTIYLDGSNGGFLAQPAVYQRIKDAVKLECKAQFVLF